MSKNSEGSVRNLPPGKLNILKKLFEDDGSDASSNMPRPPPPSRPPPPARHRSPGRKDQNSQPRVKSSSEDPSVESSQVDTTVQIRGKPGMSPTITKRITTYLTSAGATAPISGDGRARSSSNENANNSVTPGLLSSSPKPKQANAVENKSYSSKAEVDAISQLYSKVKKKKKPDEAQPVKKSVCRTESAGLARRAAARLNSEEKRKTVACLADVHDDPPLATSVASRAKMFDSPKTDKPQPPRKPEVFKRQSSVEKSCQLVEEPEAVYDQPWEHNRSTVTDLLKKHQSTVGNPAAAESASTLSKPKLTQKPSFTSSPLKQATNVKKEEAEVDSTQKPTHECVSDPPVKTKPGPPPKPPRTHAHDNYLTGKSAVGDRKSEDVENSLESKLAGKTIQVVQIRRTSAEEKDSSSEYLSVRDRITKMQKESPSPSSSNEDSVAMRHPPSRPPPPKRRPSSGGSPLSPSRTNESRPFTELMQNKTEGPVVIKINKRRPLKKQISQNTNDYQHRLPTDQLPPEPKGDQSLGRFPLRKSFSSEGLYGTRSNSLNDLSSEDQLDLMTQSSNYESEYEAVLDPDGYAIPHEFMKLPAQKKHVAASPVTAQPPEKFLVKLDGFAASPSSNLAGKGRSTASGQVTSTQEQTLDTVNKKKILMVRGKINQAYADVEFVMRGVADTAREEDFGSASECTEPQQETGMDHIEQKKRIDYCNTVRLKSSKSIRQAKEYMSAIYPQLFEYCLLVGLRPLVGEHGYEPFVLHKFPENRNFKMGSEGHIYYSSGEVSSNLSVPSFCFPDASVFKPGSMTTPSESYSFVMTHADGARVYGYCRRIQPTDASLPEVVCIISPIDAFNMYNKLLNEIECRRRISFDTATEFVAASFGRPLPKPGKTCHIRTLDENGDIETIFLHRPTDNKLENVNYESPLFYLGTDKLVKVFSSMLMERRIILCSNNLSVLTQTVHALSALLYPFQWQHVYIPLLPLEMLDVVCAPMPYIVGVLSTFLPKVLTMDLEEVFVVDLDKKNIVRSIGDESTIIPRKIQRALKTAINMCKIDSEAHNVQWLMVSEAFLRMFIEVIGHFGNHICTQQDGNRMFQREGFILEIVSKEARQFLEWFTETQMFDVFIVNHVEKSDWGTNDLFLQRLTEYRESKEETGRHRGLGAKVKNFGKVLKTKLAAT